MRQTQAHFLYQSPLFSIVPLVSLISCFSCCYQQFFVPFGEMWDIYIYIYMAAWSIAAAFLPTVSFFPVYSKKWQNCWRLCSLPVGRSDLRLAWDCNPKAFFQRKWLGLQSQAFFLVHLGFNVEFLPFWPKPFKPQKCYTYTVKVHLSKKG